VLRAASGAVGAPAEPLAPHPNYIRFNLRSKAEFPHVDELSRWLFHTVYRRRQQMCLETDLPRVATLLMGKPRPLQELSRVKKAFLDICQWEQDLAKKWNSGEHSRQQHAAVCSWTDGFHNALLREFACAEELQRGPSRRLTWMRQIPWH